MVLFSIVWKLLTNPEAALREQKTGASFTSALLYLFLGFSLTGLLMVADVLFLRPSNYAQDVAVKARELGLAGFVVVPAIIIFFGILLWVIISFFQSAFSKLFGGTGVFTQFFHLNALVVAVFLPLILLFDFIPVIGGVAAFLAQTWAAYLILLAAKEASGLGWFRTIAFDFLASLAALLLFMLLFVFGGLAVLKAVGAGSAAAPIALPVLQAVSPTATPFAVPSTDASGKAQPTLVEPTKMASSPLQTGFTKTPGRECYADWHCSQGQYCGSGGKPFCPPCARGERGSPECPECTFSTVCAESQCGNGVCEQNETPYPTTASHWTHCPEDCPSKYAGDASRVFRLKRGERMVVGDKQLFIESISPPTEFLLATLVLEKNGEQLDRFGFSKQVYPSVAPGFTQKDYSKNGVVIIPLELFVVGGFTSYIDLAAYSAS